ncbi:Sec63 complex subunit [Saccharomycopsis crataegensis]|uniref:Sec63 complex subunit n=1 Tax=Saccharomycopsis crataegensis TaxID=43959 RepID=A0AAV5QV23_9ASCO|nr:Sec63 complex subunit [Saccharomycopsis crataegensis]
MSSLHLSYQKTNKQVAFDTANKDALPLGISSEDLTEQLVQLNELAQQLISFDGEAPKNAEPTKNISMGVKKCHEAGLSCLKTAKFEEAIKHFSEGIKIATNRNKWESFQLTLFETHLCLMNRADAYLMSGKYPEALQDTDLLIKTMNVNPDNFYRRSIAHLELGFLNEAKVDLERGLAFQPNNEKLKRQLLVVMAKIFQEDGDL